jgi:hypothetical protein
MTTITNVSRRRFLTTLGLTSGGLVLGVGFATRHALIPAAPAAEPFAPNVYLSIDPAGRSPSWRTVPRWARACARRCR